MFAQSKLTVLEVFRAYAQILFLGRAWAGVVCIAATFWYPNIGFAGLLAAAIAIITSRLLRMPYEDSGLHILNALLVGLSLGAFYQLDTQLVFIILVSSLLTVFLTSILIDIFWRLGKIPILSLPFILVAFTSAFATKSYVELTPYLQLKLTMPDISYPWLDTFFSSLSAIFFIPHPLAGLLIFLAILIRSRYLALLCVSGYIVGFYFFTYLAGQHIADTIQWNGFNFSLTAMALGGFYAVPSISSFTIAMSGAAIAALLTTTLQNFLVVFGLPVMATPFLATTLIFLYALSKRQVIALPQLVLDNPVSPEVNYERARMATVRLGERNSVPVKTPFYGEWQIYQGFNDRFTHITPWQHALDFFKTQDGKSFSGEGVSVEDYFCYGLPVVSPVYGTIIRIQDNLPDNAPGEVDTQNNWGNFVLIRMANGLHLMLAHLRQHSIAVTEGANVKPGDALASCGNSGRSPQPHLHLQVQAIPVLGASTYPFHLISVIIDDMQGSTTFQLVARPTTGQATHAALADESLKNSLHFPVGRVFNFSFQDAEKTVKRQLSVELTLLGEFILKSDKHAESNFIETEDLLAFYDRKGRKDKFLDMWLLAVGVTPFSAQALHWVDSQSYKLLPLKPWQHALINLSHPLGTGLNSHYQRHYDTESHQWYQTGEHKLELGLITIHAHTELNIDTKNNRIQLSMQCMNEQWQATLQDVEQIGDEGIPSWQENI